MTGDASHHAGETWSHRASGFALTSGLLAAISGVLGLAWDIHLIAALLALASATVGALIVALTPADRAIAEHAFADANWEISGRARDLLLGIVESQPDQARAALSALRRRAHVVARRRPAPRADAFDLT
jgi:hypothetical protein